MTEHPDKEIWFPAKRYGWGWGLPCAWQGWVVDGIFLILLALLGLLAPYLFTGNQIPSGSNWKEHEWVGFHYWIQHVGNRTNIAMHAACFPSFNPLVGVAVWIVLFSLLVGSLVAVCWWKGEKPRWRWGKD